MLEIALHNILPDVFVGSEQEEPVRTSQLWLREVTFRRGRRYLVEAESGTGKSSLCSFVYGNRRDYRGSICFDGDDVRGFSARRWCDLRCRSLALLPQEMRLFPELTVRENIAIKNRLTDCKTEREIVDMLARLEVDNKLGQRAAHLSVGQQQRVATVRALCQPFDFLILDEPVSHLDARNNAAMARLIVEEADRYGAAIVATSVGNNISIEVDETIHL